MIGLNVGSGQRPFKTIPDEIVWLNIDSQAKWKPDILCDASVKIPCKTETVDYVVLHHVLEHFGCGEAAGLIKEAYRVLKPGGSLLVFVPDLHQLAIGWLGKKISTQIYMTNLYGAYMGHEEDRHKWGFDHNSLLLFLVEAARPSNPTYQVGESWSRADSFDGRIIPGADLAHDWWILEMECVK